METTTLGGYRRKVFVERYNPISGATYGWYEDDPAPAGPSGPSWAEGPVAPLPLAMSAGKAAERGGFGPPLRHDRRVPCQHCTVCDAGRYDDCRQAKSVAEARLHHHQDHDPDVATEYASALLDLVAAELSFGLAR
jgi:hypothetical protein